MRALPLCQLLLPARATCSSDVTGTPPTLYRYFADPADGLVASTAVPTFLFRSPVSEAVTAAATSSAMATPEDKRMPQPSLSGIAGTFATPQRPSMAASDKFSPALSSAHRRPIWEPREEADALGRRSALERAQASKARRRATSDLGG